MKEYLNDPVASKETLREYNGRTWLLTGDIGWMDQYGRIQIKDRKKQMIKVKGFSVFPKDVESLIGTHPKVLEVAVAGVPDKATGEAVKAWVALKPEERGTITSEELTQWCKQNITGYKVPKYLEIIDEVPKSAIGKVLRRTLQEADPLWNANKT
jgi:long-chain acyl-CoA synthetase